MPVQVGQTISAEDFAKLKGIQPISSSQPVGTTISADEFAKLSQAPKVPASGFNQAHPILGAINQFGEASGKALEAAGQFLSPSTVRNVGSTIVGGLGAGAQLYGQAMGSPEAITFGKRLETQTKPITPASIAGQALETIPAEKLIEGAMKIPGVEQATKFVGERIAAPLMESAQKQYARILAPTTMKNKAITGKVVPGLLERGVTALSRKGLLAKGEQALEKAGEAVGAVEESLPRAKSVLTKGITDALNAAKRDFTIKGTNIIAESKAIQAIDDVKNVVENLGKRASSESLISLRRIWDSTVAAAKSGKGFLVDDLGNFSLEAKKEATNAIRAELAKKFPNLANVNKEFTFWKSVTDVLDATVQRKTGQAAPLSETAMRAAGAAAGLATGGISKAVEGGVLMGALQKLVNSTAWNSISAVQKFNLAKLLAEGRGTEVLASIARWMERIGTAVSPQDQSTQMDTVR